MIARPARGMQFFPNRWLLLVVRISESLSALGLGMMILRSIVVLNPFRFQSCSPPPASPFPRHWRGEMSFAARVVTKSRQPQLRPGSLPPYLTLSVYRAYLPFPVFLILDSLGGLLLLFLS